MIDKITMKLYSRVNQDKYDYGILKYGLEVFFYNLFTILLLLCLSCLINNVQFGLVFIISFCSLRVIIGGYHAKTILHCTILTSLIFLLAFLIYMCSFTLKYTTIIFVLLMILLYKYCLNSYHIKFKLLIFSLYNFIYFFTLDIPIVSQTIYISLFLSELLFYIKKRNLIEN